MRRPRTSGRRDKAFYEAWLKALKSLDYAIRP
jgi:hypothetical protein